MARRPTWTRERIADAVRRWEAEHGRAPTVTDWTPARASAASRRRFEAGDWPHASTVRRPYGTFAAALEAAGVKPGRLPYRRIKRVRTSEWSEEDLLAAMREWVEVYGSPPTVADWNPSLARRRGQDARVKRYYADRCWPPATTVARVFGGWRAALRAAGLRVREPGD